MRSHMATEIWVNIGSDGTRPLPEPMLTDHHSSDIHIKAISQEMPHPSITKIQLIITFISNFPGANELKKRRC